MILPRQVQNGPSSSSPLATTSTHRVDPQNPTIAPPPSYAPKVALVPWQILLIVIGSLLLLAILGTLFICVRTRRAIRRGATTTRFEPAIRSGTSEFATETDTSHARRGSNARSVKGGGGVGGGGGGGDDGDVKQGRRDSVIDDAKVQIRRLIKKSRPRARSASYQSSPTSPYKAGVDFGLSALRFGGGGREKVANGAGKKGRRKNESGIDMRVRSADGHVVDGGDNDDGYVKGRAPFMQNEGAMGSASGSGFASGARLMGTATVTTSPRTDSDAFTAEARVGRERDSEDWGYGVDSIAHTVRGSFEDAEEQERQRAVAHQHHQLSAAVERLAAESGGTGSWPSSGHDRGRL